MVSTINTDENISDDIIDQDMIKEGEEISKDLSEINYRQQNTKISPIKQNNFRNDLIINEIGGGDASKSLLTVSEFGGEEIKENFDIQCN